MRSCRPATTFCTIISGESRRTREASCLIAWVKNITEARMNTIKAYRIKRPAFFTLRLSSEDRVKSMMYFCFSIQLFIDFPNVFRSVQERAGREVLQG